MSKIPYWKSSFCGTKKIEFSLGYRFEYSSKVGLINPVTPFTLLISNFISSAAPLPTIILFCLML